MKRKRGGFIADLVRPGDQILVARGGQGGVSFFINGFILILSNI